jgi:hypothetical protein
MIKEEFNFLKENENWKEYKFRIHKDWIFSFSNIKSTSSFKESQNEFFKFTFLIILVESSSFLNTNIDGLRIPSLSWFHWKKEENILIGQLFKPINFLYCQNMDVWIGSLYWCFHTEKKLYWPCRVYRKKKLYYIRVYHSKEIENGEFTDEWLWVDKKYLKSYDSVPLSHFKENKTIKLILKAMEHAAHDYKKDVPPDSVVHEDVCFYCRRIGLLIICDK